MSDHPEEERREQLHLRCGRRTAPQAAPKIRSPSSRCTTRATRPAWPRFRLCRWSFMAARLADDCRAGGRPGDTCEDLGPSALPMLCQAAQRGDFAMGEQVPVGFALGDRWVRWFPPAPVEPVPGSPGATAAGNWAPLTSGGGRCRQIRWQRNAPGQTESGSTRARPPRPRRP